MHALSNSDITSSPNPKPEENALGAPRKRIRWRLQTPFFIAFHSQPPEISMESACFTQFTKNKKVPKSKPCLQHQPNCSCTCCGPMCRSRCGKRQTSKPHLTSQPISLSSAGRSGMTSCYCLRWHRPTIPVWFTVSVIIVECRARNAAL